MNSNFRLQLKSSAYTLLAIVILASGLLASCQSAEQPAEEPVANTNQPTIAADTTTRRPAPEFFIIPKGMERKRVWICDDNMSDIFHVSNTCEALKGCLGTFRNVMLVRAIEDYGRYNCEVCSKELADIFDEDKVRDM